MHLIFDLETDGLYDDVTRVWCISIRKESDGESELYFDNMVHKDGTVVNSVGNSINDGLSLLSKATKITGHNIIGYDLPVLKKLYGWEPSEKTKIVDTLVLSRLFNPDRQGGHSLAAWGERLGFPKGDYDDWTGGLTEEMLVYCDRDTEVTHKVLLALREEIKGQRWGESIDLEHRVATIIAEQEVNGVLFDKKLAEDTLSILYDKVAEIDKELMKDVPVTVKPKGSVVNKPFTKTGAYSARSKTYIEQGCNIVGPFQGIEVQGINLNSTHQLKLWLQSVGWKPTEFTATGGGKLTEDSFSSLPDERLGKLMSDRVQNKHRIGQIEGWVKNIRDDGRITAGANPLGTNTGRMRHSKVVNVPAVYAYMGTEMRSMFCAGTGNLFVGHDASGLELRMLAHYMNDPEYTEVLLDGDIHSHNQKSAGLHSREAAKTFIYAFLYGAGDAKLGSIVEGGELEGAALRSRFLQEIPSLGRLINKTKRAARERGYVYGLDGRRVWIRRDANGRVLEHTALNTLLQNAGAVVMKKSLVLLDEWAKKEKLDYRKVVDMHDEGQAEVLAAHAQRYSELAVQSVVQAGLHFKLNVPLAAEAKIGNNWAATH